MKEYDKDIKKIYEHTGTVKADVNCLPRVLRIMVYALVAIALFGILAVVVYGSRNRIFTNACLISAVASVVGIVLIYFISSRKGPTRYYEVMFKHEGVYLVFQVVSETFVRFYDGTHVLEYKKKKISEVDAPFNPYLMWNAPLSAEYESMTRKGANKAVYLGNAEVDGKKTTYKVTTEGKFVTRFDVNGRTVIFDSHNNKTAGLTVPAPLADAIIQRGTKLPAGQITIAKR